MLHSLLLALVAVVAPWLLPARFEAGAFYHPASNHAPTPAGCQQVTFPTTDGLTLHGWFMPARGRAPGPAPTVLHVHGNTGDISNHRAVCDFLQDAGFHVLLFDYRGFGASDGASGPLRREWLVEDTRAAIDYLLTRPDVDHDRLAVFGYSLGAVLGMAASAERERVRAVVTYAGFATWRGVAADKAGPLGRLLIGRGHDATDSAAALGARPLLIVHGTRDGLVRQYHADLIAAAAAAAGVPVEQLRIDGGTHISLGSDPQVRERVVDFLTRELGVPQAAGE
ncbi:MAG: alpha/beta fold hydrolase [Phycisphaerales bacterium]|nr:alpha/beta fold hydrolase [Phycisphaerales bacterium]